MYVDLCSYDDEPVMLQKKPAFTIAAAPTLNISKCPSSTDVSTAVRRNSPIYPITSANLELFGNDSRMFNVGQQFLDDELHEQQ
jgi:hypothetical protein